MNIKTEQVWRGWLIYPDRREPNDEWHAWDDDSSIPKVYTGRTEQEAIANLMDMEDA